MNGAAWALLVERCCVDGCDKFPKFGYVACRKHVRERCKLIRSYGRPAVVAMTRRAA